MKYRILDKCIKTWEMNYLRCLQDPRFFQKRYIYPIRLIAFPNEFSLQTIYNLDTKTHKQKHVSGIFLD